MRLSSPVRGMSEPVQLTAFGVKEFKSFAAAELRLAPLTLLIGPNASGKSNLIEAMRLLSWLARGQRLDQLVRAVSDDEPSFRGSPRDLARGLGTNFELSCRFASQDDYDRFAVAIDVGGAELHISNEAITGQPIVPLYETATRAHGVHHDIEVAYNNFTRGGHKPRITCIDQQLILSQLGTPSRFAAKHADSQRLIPALSQALMSALGGALYLDPVPRLMRGYAHQTDRDLRPDGSNLSGVLFGLCRDASGRDAIRHMVGILEFVRDLPEQDVLRIGFVQTPRDEVMVQLEESFGGRQTPCDAPLLSDGTLRVLAVAAAVLSAPVGSVVVIEEIDNGVHPSRAHLLMQRLREVADERELRLVITTHNPALLDAVPPDLISAVTCCYRDPDDGTSRLMRMGDLEQYPELVAEGPLGWLMARGRIEQYLYQRSTAAERRQAALDWLREFQEAGG